MPGVGRNCGIVCCSGCHRWICSNVARASASGTILSWIESRWHWGLQWQNKGIKGQAAQGEVGLEQGYSRGNWRLHVAMKPMIEDQDCHTSGSRSSSRIQEASLFSSEMYIEAPHLCPSAMSSLFSLQVQLSRKKSLMPDQLVCGLQFQTNSKIDFGTQCNREKK